MTVVLYVCASMLAVASVLLLVRITNGPTMLDRIIAFDVFVAVLICVIGLDAAVDRSATALPILVALSLIGFIGSVSVAAFSKGSEDIEPDRRAERP